MGIALVGATQGYDTASGTTLTSDQNSGLTLNVEAGDFVVAFWSHFAVGGPAVSGFSDNGGNTWFSFAHIAAGVDGGSGNQYWIRGYFSRIENPRTALVVTGSLDIAQIERGMVLHHLRSTGRLVYDHDDEVGPEETPTTTLTSASFTPAAVSSIVLMAAHGTWGNPVGFYNVGNIGSAPATFDAQGVTATWGLAVEYRILTTRETNITASMSADSAGTWQGLYGVFDETPPPTWLPQTHVAGQGRRVGIPSGVIR